MFEFENLWKKFGVYYGNMDQNDKYMIASLILDVYDLDEFKNEHDENNDNINKISRVPIEFHSFYRTFIG